MCKLPNSKRVKFTKWGKIVCEHKPVTGTHRCNLQKIVLFSEHRCSQFGAIISKRCMANINKSVNIVLYFVP